MKGFLPLTIVALLALTGALHAQTKAQRIPTGAGQTGSLFEERTSPATERRIRTSENTVMTQAETIRALEARVKELEAELAALKAAAAAPVTVPAPSAP